MGKQIIKQRRGKGSNVFRVRDKASQVRPGYPSNLSGEFEVVNLIPSLGHTTPIAKLMNKQGFIFYNFACDLMYVGQKINFGGSNAGDIVCLKDLKNGTEVFNIENSPKDGGKFVRAGGNVAIISGRSENAIRVMMPSKMEREFDMNCRATVGRLAGDGRLEKPILKAGKQFFIKKGRSKYWPRTSAVKMNALEHPFGSGRGKRIKSKIAKRNAPPGANVGTISPRRTGRTKK